MEQPILLKVEEVARAMALSRSKIYELLASGEIPSVTIGRARRVPVEALEQWLADQVEPRLGRRPATAGREETHER